ncbi:MAG: hypothetical protein HIU84_06370 [Acidobacteria bacterium]|nr:hypothetical protein [Acidobacteriota bacterium]
MKSLACCGPRRFRNCRLGIVAVVVASLCLMTLVARKRGYEGMGGNTVVRCRGGHLFTTIWVPGVSIKSLRLGWWRLQYCPVGKHWTIVVPVKVTTLSDEEREAAAEIRDIRLP